MEVTMDVLQRFTDALLQLLIQPFYYLGIVFIILQYRRQVALERKLFHTRLHSLLDETWRTIVWGFACGVAASVVMAFLGAGLQLEAVIALWCVSVVLILFRVRYLCFAYAAGVIGLAQALLKAFPALTDKADIPWLTDPLLTIEMPSLLCLVAVLHVAEAIMMRTQGTRTATPLFLEGKRGKIVGGYQLQGFWPIPLFLIVPVSGGSMHELPWPVFFSGEMLKDGWSMIAFPVVIGFGALTVSRLPQQTVRRQSGLLFLYAIVLFGAAVIAELWSPFVAVASLLAIALHEALVWYCGWEDEQRSPLYVHDQRGLFILGVLPGSPAAEMGLATGEIVHKVNGQRVHSKEELHMALRINAAFCKIEVINLEGQSKFVQRALYSGEHHQLGIILAPDRHATVYAVRKQPTVFAYIRSKWIGVSSRSMSGSETGSTSGPRSGSATSAAGGKPEPPAATPL